MLLDITATHEQRGTLLDAVRRAARELFVPFTVGGGIRSLEDAAAVFEAGADKMSINSAAVRTPALITRSAERFGSQAVVVAIDAKRVPTHAEAGEAQWRCTSPAAALRRSAQVLDWAREVERARRGRNSADLDGPRRHAASASIAR